MCMVATKFMLMNWIKSVVKLVLNHTCVHSGSIHSSSFVTSVDLVWQENYLETLFFTSSGRRSSRALPALPVGSFSILRRCLVSAVRRRAASSRSSPRAWSCVDSLHRSCLFAIAAMPHRPWICCRWRVPTGPPPMGSANRERMWSSPSQEGLPPDRPCTVVAGAAAVLLLPGAFLLSHRLFGDPCRFMVLLLEWCIPWWYVDAVRLVFLFAVLTWQ